MLVNGSLIHARGHGWLLDSQHCKTVMAEVKSGIFAPTQITDMEFHCYFDNDAVKEKKDTTIPVTLKMTTSNIRPDFA